MRSWRLCIAQYHCKGAQSRTAIGRVAIFPSLPPIYAGHAWRPVWLVYQFITRHDWHQLGQRPGPLEVEEGRPRLVLHSVLTSHLPMERRICQLKMYCSPPGLGTNLLLGGGYI